MPRKATKPQPKFVKELAPNFSVTVGEAIADSKGSFAKIKIPDNYKLLLIPAAVILLAAVGFGTKSYADLRHARTELAAMRSQSPAEDETKQIVERVSQLVVLPENEEPTLATVTDQSKLASQPFFANAETGDQVLIYTKAQRAILFRPSNNKIIEVAPLNIGSPVSGSPGTVAGESDTPASNNTAKIRAANSNLNSNTPRAIDE